MSINRDKFSLHIVMISLFISFFLFAQQASGASGPIETKDYKISLDNIARSLKLGTFLDIPITITNYRTSPASISFSLEGDIGRIISLDKDKLNLEGGASEDVKATIFAENVSFYSGELIISGDIKESIPVNVTVSEITAPPIQAITLEIDFVKERVSIGSIFKYKVDVQNLLSDRNFEVALSHSIDKSGKDTTYIFNKSFFTETDHIRLNTSTTILKEFEIPEFIRPGDYIINVKAEYAGLDSTASRRFTVTEPIMDYMIFGILPLRWLLFVSSFLFLGAIGFLLYKRKMAKKKRYATKVDYNLLPKPGPRSALIGRIADTTKKAYFDLDQLTTHTLVAGSTGGGKTVSTEVLIEEALLKGAAVIVFDPTAQWTGMLRKCTEKKMLDLYKKFDMKKTEARAFNGNIKQIMDAREVIEIKKFIKPGEINIFSISKLDPEDIDILVANTIRQVFHANFAESPELKLLVIFDEVHRLLPKFGGSGEGFIQIERACREFRKWGVGLFLISQVLTDFVGETKANINTEIQMRTRDQGDLDRIKNKYGGYMLQSLLKASTGTGMIENSAYNRGDPYFVAFRPLLHEHARLSDDELENYNRYNSMIEDLDFQIEQLEKEGIDVFDMRLELKMALDKVKSGSFNMVTIYLEGLTPRIKTQWDKLGKQPKKREIKLVSKEELKAELEKAREARKKFEEEDQKKTIVLKKDKKELEPLRLKSGIVVANKSELIDALSSMDEKTYKEHVTELKNDFADWIRNINAALADKLGAAKTRQEMLELLQSEKEEG